MDKISKKIIFLLTLAVFLTPHILLAADISFKSKNKSFNLGQEVLVEVFLDTDGVMINAIEASILYPTNLLKLKETKDGNSSVNFWIEKPKEVSKGKIEFSGITAGGFSGSDRLILGLVFEPIQVGSAEVTFDAIQVLQNDGSGTRVSTTKTSFNFSVLKTNDTSTKENLDNLDQDPPESFEIFLGKDQNILDNKNFIAFSTVDKNSGIDHYEVKESYFGLTGEYIEAESPYLLKDQSLKSIIYVKAVDKDGNEQVSKIGPQNKLAWFPPVLILAIILVVFLFIRKKYGKN